MKEVEEKIRETIDSYSLSADQYVANTQELSKFPDVVRDLDLFLSMLPGRDILDAAFGSGRDIAYFCSKGMNVVGIELTQEFISIASGRLDAALLLMDMRRLDFPSERFDGIWCCASFSHIPKEFAVNTINGFARVLRDRGILFLSFKIGIGERLVSTGNIEAPRYFFYYSKEEIQVLLEGAGFKVVRIILPEEKGRWISVFAKKL